MRIWLAILAFAFFMSCENPSAPLIAGLKSYASIESVFVSLALKTKEIDTVEKSGLKQGDSRPPFNIFTIEFDHAEYGLKGRLRLSFFNGKLASSIFFPADFQKYLMKLKENREINLIAKEEESKEGARFWKSTDYKGRSYVGSEDEVLEKEIRSWIRRYS